MNASTFTNNDGYNAGGAIGNGDGGSGTLTVTDSTFTNNTDGDGDGAAINNGEQGSGRLTVTDSTFTDNTANGEGTDGGAIDNGDYQGSGTLTVTDSTFTNNTAVNDGAIANGAHGGTADVVAAADIFAGSCSQGTGTWTDVGANVGSDTTCQHGGTGDAISATLASEMGPLANNGGPTQTMLLLSGNPASGLIPMVQGCFAPSPPIRPGLPARSAHRATPEPSSPIP